MPELKNATITVSGYGTPFAYDKKRSATVQWSVIVSGVSIGLVLTMLLDMPLPRVIWLGAMAAVWICFLFAFIRDYRRPTSIALQKNEAYSCPVMVGEKCVSICIDAVKCGMACKSFIPIFNDRYIISRKEGGKYTLTGAISWPMRNFVRKLCVKQSCYFRPKTVTVTMTLQEADTETAFNLLAMAEHTH